MFDIGWSELAVIGVVALVVIGPKDLPRALYTVGKYVRKARLLASDFQGHVDQMVRDAELDEMRRKFDGMASPDPVQMIGGQVEKLVDADGSLRQALNPEPPVFGAASSTEASKEPSPNAAPTVPPDPDKPNHG